MDIFRAYDIRGVYPTEIDETISYKIALAYANYLKPKRVVIGRDVRKSSKQIHDAFVRGLRDSGVNVTSIGHSTTPMLTFAGFNYSFDGAVMITASHLAKQFNGIKLYREKSIPLSGPKGIYKIRSLIKQDNFRKAKKKGTIKQASIKKEYHNFLSAFTKKTDLKIIVDCGNGMAHLDIPFLKKLAKVTVLYERPNMNFPNHIANPNKKEARTAIIKRMKSGKYDLGIIFDGDCDRVGFVDEKAKFIPMDHSTGMIALYFLEKVKNKKMIYEIRTTLAVPEEIKDVGGRPLMSKAGHSFIHQAMIKNDAVFGGEKSGHYFFKAFNYADNALLATIHMLNHLDGSQLSCSALAGLFNKYEQIPETNFGVKDKEKAMKKVESFFKNKAKKIRKLDGISIYLKDGWFNLRKSNTESLLRLNAEANTKEEVRRIKQQVAKIIKSVR